MYRNNLPFNFMKFCLCKYLQCDFSLSRNFRQAAKVCFLCFLFDAFLNTYVFLLKRRTAFQTEKVCDRLTECDLRYNLSLGKVLSFFSFLSHKNVCICAYTYCYLHQMFYYYFVFVFNCPSVWSCLYCY